MLKELEVLGTVSRRLEAARIPCDVRNLLDGTADRKYLAQWAVRLGVAQVLEEISG